MFSQSLRHLEVEGTDTTAGGGDSSGYGFEEGTPQEITAP